MEDQIKSFIGTLPIDELYSVVDINKILLLAISHGNKKLIATIVQYVKAGIDSKIYGKIIRIIGLQKLKRLIMEKSPDLSVLYGILSTYYNDASLHEIHPPNINKRIIKSYIKICVGFKPMYYDAFETMCFKYNILGIMQIVTHRYGNVGKRDFLEALLEHNCNVPKNIDFTGINAQNIQDMQFKIVNYKMIKKYMIPHFRVYQGELYKQFGNRLLMNIRNPKLALIVERHKIIIEPDCNHRLTDKIVLPNTPKNANDSFENH